MENKSEILKRLEKIKKIGYGTMTAGLVTALVCFGGTIYSSETAGVVDREIEEEKALIYMDNILRHDFEGDRELYNAYRDDKITAKEFNERIEATHSKEFIDEAMCEGDINMTTDIHELQEEKDRLAKQAMVMSVPAMFGTFAAIMGGAVIGEPASDKIKKIEREKEMGE